MSVYMEPLIDELIKAWEEGVWTYDRATKTNFRMLIKSFSVYDVNGYRFHTMTYEQSRPNRRTTDTGVFTPGQDGVEYFVSS